MTDAETSTRGPLLSMWGATADTASLRATLREPRASLPVANERDWDPVTVQAIHAVADAERVQPWPQPLARQYARFFQDGNRTEYEERVFTRQARLTRAVVLAAATGDDTWVAEAVDGMVLLCEQSSWVWPAHEDTPRLNGTVHPDVSRPGVDLGAGEVAGQLAWADHLLGSKLDARFPGVRERVREETTRRVIHPFLRRRDWHWLGLDGNVHNWCPWICGNVLVAALQLAEDADERTAAVRWAIEGLDRYLAALPPDGSIDEGYEYWWNGACRALEALDVLAHATSGALDATGVPVVRETVAFPHRMHLGGEWYLNVADARARPPREQPWQALHRWARLVGDDDAAAHAASHRASDRPVADPVSGLGRMIRALNDDAWRTAEPTAPPLVRSVWFEGTQLGLAREVEGDAAGLTLAIKGGHNDENHNHNDVGTVVVAVDGVPVLVDAGRPTYTAQTFSPDRYSIWSMQSSWHNVPEVRGTPQHQGAEFRARDVSVVDEAGRFQVRLDLAQAYPVPGLRDWWRTAELDRGGHRVSIEDHWTFDETGPAESAPTHIHYLIAGEVESPAPGQVVIRSHLGARPTLLTWDPAYATATLTTRELADPMLSGTWGTQLTRLELRVPEQAQGRLAVTAEVLT